jgi:signal transduction histidine kinase
MAEILFHLFEEQTRLSEQGSRAKSDFLANMSHELRTPLNAIIGFSELMLDGKVQTEEERNEYLRDILASGRHLQELINDILDLSKVEAGKMEFHPERIRISDLVDELLLTLRVMAEDKRIELSSKVVDEVEEVVLDRTRLRQVQLRLERAQVHA